MGWLNFFKKKPAHIERYQLVERTDGDTVHSGIKLLIAEYENIIVELGPKVSLREENECLILDFTFNVVANPENKNYTHEALTPVIGDIISELIEADYMKPT